MATKHLFEDAIGLVDKAVLGAASTNPSLRVYAPHRVVYDVNHSRDKVALLAGGGAGHEPSFTGLTGRGLLTVAVSGDIFASPSAAQILSGVDLAKTDKGLVVIVNNYTGDCLNFGLAAEKARAAYKSEGDSKHVEMVIVGDDVAVGRTKGGLVGRRGLTGVAFVCKALGAAAEQGADAPSLGKLGRAIVDNVVTIGSSFDHCHVPGRSKDDTERGALGPDAVEIGMGIHNEPGVKHLDKKPDAKGLISEMLTLLLNPDDKERAFVPFAKDDDPVLVVNNLGGMSNLELSACATEVQDQLLNKWQLRPVRVYVGSYITSLNAPGFNISLFNHKKIKSATNTSFLELLDAPTDAAGWVGVGQGWSNEAILPTAEEQLKQSKEVLEGARKSGHGVSGNATGSAAATNGPVNQDPEQVRAVIERTCEAVIKIEPTLTKYDTIVGDGDAGETLRGCSEAVLKALKEGKIPLDRATATILGIGQVIESAMGGTSGAIYALFFTGLVQGLLESTSDAKEPATTKHWGHAAVVALDNLGNYTPARPGDRTLVDALDPFCHTLDKQGGQAAGATTAMAAAVDAAKKGAEHTRDLTARLGRATYVSDTAEKVPDPGAWGVWALVEGIRSAF